MQNLLPAKLAVHAVYNSSQEIHLIRRKIFGLLLEQRRVLVDDILTGRLEVLLCSNLVRMNPYQSCQLLHIRRVIVHPLTNLFGQLFRDPFTRSFETTADIVDPIRCSYFL